ncbi:MAG: class II fructose-bisphosphate aldolase [Bacillota bacterium]|nr:class II fructose-bisphosphate aldolase [Bacillota bacterium]
MSLVKVNELLQHATEHHYGVAAINTINYETISCAIAAAEAERVPVIIQFYPGFDQYIPLSHIAYMAKDLARKASVPVAVHLDHSASYEIAVGGIRDGFPSVMVDGSARPFEENLAMTKAVVETAAVFGVDVEAELGHVGNAQILDDLTNADHLTDPDKAVEFVEKTGCGSLAIAVGNAHGNYIQTPNLNFDRIRELRKAVSIPLVLHGCSGIPDEQMQEAVNLGLSKFNIATEYFAAMYRSLDQGIETSGHDGNGVQLLFTARQGMIDFVASKMRLLNPNKYSL